MNKFRKSGFSFILYSVIAAYAVIALFGMSIVIMPSEHGGMTSGACPLMRDIGSVCQAGIFDHMLHWNMLFAAIIAPIFVVSAAILFARFTPLRIAELSPPHERYRRYAQNTPHSRLFQPLLLLFAGGIIQPKIFTA